MINPDLKRSQFQQTKRQEAHGRCKHYQQKTVADAAARMNMESKPEYSLSLSWPGSQSSCTEPIDSETGSCSQVDGKSQPCYMGS